VVELTFSHSASVSGGTDSNEGTLPTGVGSGPELHRDGAIIHKQSPKGSRIKSARIVARSSIDWMGPGLTSGPRRRWYSRRSASASSGGKAKSTDDPAALTPPSSVRSSLSTERHVRNRTNKQARPEVVVARSNLPSCSLFQTQQTKGSTNSLDSSVDVTLSIVRKALEVGCIWCCHLSILGRFPPKH
jgi:hypothetical protein